MLHTPTYEEVLQSSGRTIRSMLCEILSIFFACHFCVQFKHTGDMTFNSKNYTVI